jgi:sortase A
LLLIPNIYNKYEENKIDEVVEEKIKKKDYDEYIYFKSLDRKLIIKNGNTNEILSNNDVAVIYNGSLISDETGNYVLAGHNNKHVFNMLYKLKIKDEIIISDNYINYLFEVYEIKTVNITDTYILDNIYNNRIITLITCTKDNQKRLVVIGKYKSHNFT